MLTEDQKYKNQMKYLELIARLGIDMTSFTKYLISVDYFNKPATTQYAYSYDGGLCEQALKLCVELSALCEAYFLHNICEAGCLENPRLALCSLFPLHKL